MLKISNSPLWISLIVVAAIALPAISCAATTAGQAGAYSNLPVTPVELLHKTGFPPAEPDMAKYRLTVDGLVDKPLSLTYDEILKYPTVTDVVLMECPGVFIDNAEWTGVPVATLLNEAGIQQQGTKIVFYAIGGYQKTLPRDKVMKNEVYLAHTVDGQVLPLDHGYPLRLVVKGEYGSN